MKSILLTFLAAVCVAAAAADRKPNIVVIVSDDAGYNEFSMHGSTTFLTPRIDSIAANGVRFTNGYVSGTVCSPTRAGLLTGRYQQRFGHEFNIPASMNERLGMPLEEKTIADVLKAANYRTIAVGKWHLGYAPKFHPMERGFTDYYGFLQGSRSYFPLAKPSPMNRLMRDREPVPEKFEYMTDELARAGAEYIAKHKAEPFFLYLAFTATHSPSHALQSDLDAAGSGGRGNARAMSLALDRGVGVILDELKKQALADNTLVVFVNDNGGAAGHDNAPLRGHKGGTWEGGMRVAFAMQWPAVLPKGKVYDHPVIALDIFPTAMAAAGVKQTIGKPLDGVDLVPFLTGKTKGRPHQTLFWKHGPAWAVRDGDLKLVAGDSKEAASVELFDVSADASESRNLAGMKPEEVTRMQKMLNDWKKDFPPTPWGKGLKEEE